MRRLTTRIGLLLTVGTLAACNPTPAAPELTDPHEIVARTIDVTAGLRSARIRIDLEMRDKAQPAERATVEGVLDLGAGEMSIAGQEADGSGAFAFIIADGASFTRTSDNGRWTRMPAMGMAGLFLFGGLGAAQPDVRGALVDLLDDAETAVELRGVEDCASARCYRTAVLLPPAQFWKLFVGLTGIDRMRGGQGVQPPLEDVPALQLEILTDTASLRLVEIAGSASLDGNGIAFRLQVGAPNEPVSIEPPPPGLVDVGGDFGVGGGVVAPVPVQVDPVPAETAVPATDGP